MRGELPNEVRLTQLQQDTIAERKPRKSVAFSEGATIVDENGEVSVNTDGVDGSKDTAMSHSSTPTFQHP
jgi:hypothetical protein